MTRIEIETPALLVDLDRMEANIERMAAFFRGVPAKLQPHFKNHKSPALADRQLQAGAIGLTCATIHEVDCLVRHGVKSLLLANEIVDPLKIRRLVELSRQSDVIVCVDNEAVVAEMGRASRESQTPLSVVVDVNVGMNRCGVPPGEPSVRMARLAVESGLRFRGLMGYEGHIAHQMPGHEKEQAVAAAMLPLVETKAAIERSGLPVEMVTVGGTGTTFITGRHPGVTELQSGSYLLMDCNYRQCCAEFDLTLTVLATVISKTRDEFLVLDAGVKTISCERGIPTLKDRPGMVIRRVNAEHSIVEVQDGAAPVSVGDQIEIWVEYSDATINLNDRLYGVRNGKVEEVFRLEGRP